MLLNIKKERVEFRLEGFFGSSLNDAGISFQIPITLYRELHVCMGKAPNSVMPEHWLNLISWHENILTLWT